MQPRIARLRQIVKRSGVQHACKQVLQIPVLHEDGVVSCAEQELSTERRHLVLTPTYDGCLAAQANALHGFWGELITEDDEDQAWCESLYQAQQPPLDEQLRLAQQRSGQTLHDFLRDAARPGEVRPRLEEPRGYPKLPERIDDVPLHRIQIAV